MESGKDALPLTEAFYYILVALYGGPSHGYGIMQDVEKMSRGRVTIGAGTLYTALNTLVKKQLIASAGLDRGADARRKMYAITDRGREALHGELNRLELLLQNGRHAISRKGSVNHEHAE